MITIIRDILSAFGVVGWIELVAALVVAVGCAGELWILINRLTLHIEPLSKSAGIVWRALASIDRRFRPVLVRLKIRGRKLPEAKEQLLERLFVLLVAAGVTVEFMTLPFAMLEIAHVNNEASRAIENAAKANERAETAGKLAGEANKQAALANERAEKEAKIRASLEKEVAMLLNDMYPRMLGPGPWPFGIPLHFVRVRASVEYSDQDPTGDSKNLAERVVRELRKLNVMASAVPYKESFDVPGVTVFVSLPKKDPVAQTPREVFEVERQLGPATRARYEIAGGSLVGGFKASKIAAKKIAEPDSGS